MTAGYKFGDIQNQLYELAEELDDISSEKLTEVSKSIAEPVLKNYLSYSSQSYQDALLERREFESRSDRRACKDDDFLQSQNIE